MTTTPASSTHNTQRWNLNSLRLIRSDLSRIHRGIMLRRSRFPELAASHDLTILDLGCGSGAFLRHFHEQGYRRLFGVEPDADLIRQIPPDCAVVKQGYAQRLGFDDCSFDVVFIYGVLHHLKGLEAYGQALDEVRRVLRPGGRLFILEPGHWRMFRALEICAKLLGFFSPTFRAFSDVLDEEQPDVHFFIRNHLKVREHLISQGFLPLVDRYFLYSWLFTASKPA